MKKVLAVLFAVALGLNLSAQTDCPPAQDANQDGLIGVDDLMDLLSHWADQDSDGDGIYDSVDDCIGMYDACDVCNGVGEDADEDGLCDDVDDCVGAYDECGVCNGPGPTFPVIDEIVYATDSVFLEPLDEWYVFEFATDTLFTYVCPVSGCTDETAGNYNPEAVIEDDSCEYGPAECGGASTVTFDGYTYELVAIGDQCWFAENLRTTVYATGDDIEFSDEDSFYDTYDPGYSLLYFETTDEFEEAYAEDPYSVIGNAAYTFYDLDSSLFEIYGNHYNWGAVMDPRGLCPLGWHVSSFEDWSVLELHAGLPVAENEVLVGEIGIADSVGMKLRSEDLWTVPGVDLFGFSAVPGGHTSNFSKHHEFSGTWWTSSYVTGYGSGYRMLGSSVYYEPFGIYRSAAAGAFGRSVRCVRD